MTVVANAAERYDCALALLPEKSKQVKRLLERARGVTTARVSRPELDFVNRAQPALHAFREGSTLPNCEWPLATGAAIKDFLDAPMPMLADVVCLRARRHFQENEDALAFDLLADLMLFAHRVGRAGPLLSRLVHVALVRMATDLAGAHLLRQAPSVLEDFASRLRRLPDPGTLRDSMRCERHYLLEVERPRYEGQSRDATRALLLSEGCDDTLADAIIQAGDADPDGVPGQLDAAAAIFNELGEIAMLPRTHFLSALQAFLDQHLQKCPAISMVTWGIYLMHAESILWRTRAGMLWVAIGIASSGNWRRAVRDPARNPYLHRRVPGGFALLRTPDLDSDVKLSFYDPITLLISEGSIMAGWAVSLRCLLPWA